MLLKKVVLVCNIMLLALFFVAGTDSYSAFQNGSLFNSPIIFFLILLLNTLFIGILAEDLLDSYTKVLFFAIFGTLLFLFTLSFLIDEFSNIGENNSKLAFLVILSAECFYNFVLTKNIYWEINGIKKRTT